ncbi:MAG: hypothetical protein WCA26_17755 [Xanthobacteraceae bacterium]
MNASKATIFAAGKSACIRSVTSPMLAPISTMVSTSFACERAMKLRIVENL